MYEGDESNGSQKNPSDGESLYKGEDEGTDDDATSDYDDDEIEYISTSHNSKEKNDDENYESKEKENNDEDINENEYDDNDKFIEKDDSDNDSNCNVDYNSNKRKTRDKKNTTKNTKKAKNNTKKTKKSTNITKNAKKKNNTKKHGYTGKHIENENTLKLKRSWSFYNKRRSAKKNIAYDLEMQLNKLIMVNVKSINQQIIYKFMELYLDFISNIDFPKSGYKYKQQFITKNTVRIKNVFTSLCLNYLDIQDNDEWYQLILMFDFIKSIISSTY